MALCTIGLSTYAQKKAVNFVKTNGKTFTINGKPYYYVGANYWYGSLLASKVEEGDRKRLIKELNILKAAGVTNLRVLAGAEGPDNEPSRVSKGLQLSKGQYNSKLIDGLDFLLAEMKKRNMYVVLYLNNTWEWSGGYAQYLNWNGYGPIPYPSIKPNTWAQFMKYGSQFHSCEPCMSQYEEFIKYVVTRTNTYNGIKYTEDPTIMSWEIANEPRALNNENIPAFEKWISRTAAYIKSLDKNHLVTTGSEGAAGCENSIELFERIHNNANIDYLTVHIWPKNWGWLNPNDIPGSVDISIAKTNEYIDQHLQVAEKLNKPLVFEEFGLPRDKHTYSLDDKTTCRDKYYENAFEQVVSSIKSGKAMVGCNFWAFGGTARPNPKNIYWKKGDQLMGDPPQEEQGLNSVFDTDQTMKLVKTYSKKIKQAVK
jgi:mannan endo-1,4-beta-mannosidase